MLWPERRLLWWGLLVAGRWVAVQAVLLRFPDLFLHIAVTGRHLRFAVGGEASMHDSDLIMMQIINFDVDLFIS